MELKKCPLTGIASHIRYDATEDFYDISPTSIATIREDLVENNEVPPAMNVITGKSFDLRNLMGNKFLCAQPDGLEYEEWNGILHIDGQLIAINTIDFNLSEMKRLSDVKMGADINDVIPPTQELSSRIGAQLNFLEALFDPTKHP